MCRLLSVAVGCWLSLLAVSASSPISQISTVSSLTCFCFSSTLKTLFPVPGLKTKHGHDMFYMRPSRYIPSQTSTKKIIDNLAYVMHTMLSRNSHSDTYGIGFLANMDDWTMKNFDVDYCYQFMMTLQGYVIPVRVQLFLIVNPPSWFDVIWKIMIDF